MTEIKTVFIVQGYEFEREGQLLDMAQIEVYAKTEKEAIAKARGYIKKKHYRVSQVIEK